MGKSLRTRAGRKVAQRAPWKQGGAVNKPVLGLVLGGMIGRKVARWGIAAGVAGGYVLLLLAAQSVFVGVRS